MIGMTIAFAQRAAAALGRVNEVPRHRVPGPQSPIIRSTSPQPAERNPAAGFGDIAFRGVTFTYPTIGQRNRDRWSRARRVRSRHGCGSIGGRGRRHRFGEVDGGPTCSSGSTTSTRARSRSTASTSVSSASTICVGRSASCSRTRSCSTTPYARTSHSRSCGRRGAGRAGRPSGPARTTSSWVSRRLRHDARRTRFSRCREVSDNGSRLLERSWPTRGFSSWTMRRRRSTRRRSTRSVTPWPP